MGAQSPPKAFPTGDRPGQLWSVGVQVGVLGMRALVICENDEPAPGDATHVLSRLCASVREQGFAGLAAFQEENSSHQPRIC
jgi:hypothetical protein